MNSTFAVLGLFSIRRTWLRRSGVLRGPVDVVVQSHLASAA